MLALLERGGEWNGTMRAEWIDPERVWLRSHQNIVDFTAALPPAECMRIKGEDLLSHPELYLPQIAEWLGVRTDQEAIEAMMHPENSPYARFGPANAKYGNDPNFLENSILKTSDIAELSLNGALEWAPEREFSKATRKLAKELGYS